jgi:hypothetical protein
MTTATKSAFAKQINRAPSYVTELIQHGRIVLTADGKRVEVEASLKRLEETASGANPAVAQRHEQARKAGTRKKREPVKVEEGTRQFYELQLQQTKINHKQLDFDLVLGKRFVVGDVRREAQALGNTMRASLERLIDQTAPRLAVIKDQAQRKALLDGEIKQLARVIKSEFPRAMRRLRKGA